LYDLSMTEKKKIDVNKEISDLAKIVSGEMSLRKKEESLKKAKEQAVEDQKNKRRKKIKEGSVKLEEDPIEDKKVVQNIKLYEWVAKDRYQFNFNSKLFLIIVAISLVFILLLAILGHYWLMAALIALLFFVYVSGTTAPLDVTHKITARGIDTGGKLHEWFMLKEFYFTNRNGQNLLIVNTNLNYPGSLILLLDEKERNTLFVLLQEKILYKDIRKQNRLDKINLGEYIPLEEL